MSATKPVSPVAVVALCALTAAWISVAMVWFEGDEWVPDYYAAQGIRADDLQ